MNGRAVRLGLGLVTLVLMLTALYMVFVYVPTEADQGIVQRIFYFHVPCAWVAFASFALVAIAGVFYLWLGQQIWDDLGYAAAETGMVFCTLVLVTGSIWAKPIWGAWWTWDSRLTTTLILWLLYGGYLMLRAMADEQESADCADTALQDGRPDVVHILPRTGPHPASQAKSRFHPR